ncbi:tRNA wybutosine-synthesizing protein 2 homolog [Plakobranchus ocellatus]|uniref:tRNA(Phe) (4-demethylwyosine(37)-C(7)) aminocarboxypropyltransferase n=1 Tax=Plakobranchus ocellatus TaxID=259542 RepID=A0AAV4CCX8_9GAST|nr:tRNA wybutosine-synthesizing protein 2 homolog [Plakobranchus ocellatus]
MMPSKEKAFALSLIIPREQAKKARQKLEDNGLFDPTYKLSLLEGGCVAIPVKQDSMETVSCLWPDHVLKYLSLPLSQKIRAKSSTPASKLTRELESFMHQRGISNELRREIPKKWERHQDLVIIPASSFVSIEWEKITNLWELVARCLSCQRLARHAPIANDNTRSSQVALLLGNNGLVIHTDNGIRYSYDVTKCMFSAGNITEKLRIASLDCTGETVVDLYAGIGYFTLPYLVHAGANHVHSCEWNPYALSALRQNLHDNGVLDRCTVHQGDCRLLNLPPVADRVNLGLIPSSEDGWPTAIRVLREKGGVLHIHSNVEESFASEDCTELNTEVTALRTENSSCLSGKDRLRHACRLWSSCTQEKILTLLHSIKGSRQWSVQQMHLEVIKSYAPHIVHVVLDLKCSPNDV